MTDWQARTSTAPNFIVQHVQTLTFASNAFPQLPSPIPIMTLTVFDIFQPPRVEILF